MNSQPIQIPIAEGYYVSDSLPISAQQCVNWYPNTVQAVGLSQKTLFGTPGLLELVNTGEIQQANRGSHVKDGIPYFVNGGCLYRLERTIDSDLSETFSYTELGEIEGTIRVSMSDNGSQLLVLVPGGKGYIYDESADPAFQEITDTDFYASGNPEQVVFIDGYFVLTTDEKKFIVSSLNDGLSYNALDFGSAEADPDAIVAPIVYKNQLFILGSETVEVFQNIGGANFPFQRVNGYIFDKGLSGAFLVSKTDGTFVMIGGGVNESPAVWLFNGNGFSKISTTAIDLLIQGHSDTELSNGFSWSYASNGAYFVGFSFGNTTIVYDVVSQKWHQRSSVINELDDRFRINSLVTAYGRVLVGDSQEGIIGEMSTDVYTEYGTYIKRIASSPNMSENLVSKVVPSIELTVESGVGNSDRSNPKISMEFSDDGGKTFSYERIRSMGKIGEYGKRAIWRRNGRFPRFRLMRFKMSDPVKPVIINLVAYAR